MMLAALSLALMTTVGAPDPAANLPTSRDDQVQTFALLTASALVASSQCADIMINQQMLNKAKAFFRAGSDDPAVVAAVQADVAAMKGAITRAPSLQAWCDQIYGFYGPDGSLVPGFMQR